MNETYIDPNGTERYRTGDICPDITYMLNQTYWGNLRGGTEYGGMETPEGYGITVFPKLTWVLDRIFEYFGFNLKPAFWHTDPEFSKLVLLNSAADVCVKGAINFGDVVPECMAGAFLDCLCKKFNCAYDVDVERKTAEFMFLDDILSQRTGLQDITPFLTDNLTVVFPEPKQVRLKNARNLELTGTETSSYRQLMNKYPDLRILPEAEFSTAVYNATYRLATGSYYIEAVYVGGGFYRSDTKWLGSNFYGWDGDGNIAAETFDSPDECVPQCRVVIGVWDNTVVMAAMPYAGRRRHLYTAVETDGKEEDPEQSPEQKIMLVFPNGIKQYSVMHEDEGLTNEYWLHASQLSHNEEGVQIRPTGLLYNGSDGLYERFWKRTDAAMRNEYRSLKGIFRFPYRDFFALRFNRLYLLNGQPVIIKSKKYAITKQGIAFKEIELVTV
jgi:hypothetical protein